MKILRPSAISVLVIGHRIFRCWHYFFKMQSKIAGANKHNQKFSERLSYAAQKGARIINKMNFNCLLHFCYIDDAREEQQHHQNHSKTLNLQCFICDSIPQKRITNQSGCTKSCPRTLKAAKITQKVNSQIHISYFLTSLGGVVVVVDFWFLW